MTTPARQPGARPPSGGWIDSTSSPLRAISHEFSEFEFHISPAPSSSRPQTGVGTCGTSSSSRRAQSGSSLRRCGLSTDSATSGMMPSRQRRTSYRKSLKRPAARVHPRQRRRAQRRRRVGSVPARSQNVPPARAPQVPSGRGRGDLAARAPPQSPRRCGRSGGPSGHPPRAEANTDRPQRSAEKKPPALGARLTNAAPRFRCISHHFEQSVDEHVRPRTDPERPVAAE